MSCLDQPSSVEIKICDGLFVKSMEIKRKYTLVPQHSHTYDHLSMLAKGSVRVWKDDAFLGDFIAPAGILIEKHAKHRFLSLEDDTIVYCIHRLHGTDDVELHEENALTEIDQDYLNSLEVA